MSGKNQSSLQGLPSTDATTTHDHGLRYDVIRKLHVSVVDGPMKKTQWQSKGSTCVVGSHPSCDVILEDPTVSRFHCELIINDHQARVRDSGSRNGTLLDGVLVVEAYVRDGSILRIGTTVLRIDYAKETSRLAISDQTHFGRMVGTSLAMRNTYSLLERAANSSSTVLLTGETGTGKTVAARSIHEKSNRADKPFVVVDCGSLPESLINSELFGHEKGAFTGADSRRLGAFEEAHGGTLFLDEIGELPLSLQPKFLGVLESGAVRRLGKTGTQKVNVRLIAATHRDLRSDVNAGRFRSDLYYRLAVIQICLPALRERLNDLSVLAQATLHNLGATSEQIDSLLSANVLEHLGQSSWPGNVRQLRNYLERCLVFEDVLPIEEEENGNTNTRPRSDLPYAEAKKQALYQFERLYLTDVLAQHESKVSAAAAAAEIDRTYFYRLLRRHRLMS